jgi:hypothetical protein
VNIDFSLISTVFVNMTDDQQQLEMAVEEREWDVTASRSARNTINPIRRIIDRCKLLPNPDKPLISLSIGEI